MSLATHPFIFANTTPWRPQLASASEVGIGTEFPAGLNIAQVCEIYWRRKRFTLNFSITHPDLGTHSADNFGGVRREEGIDLITPTDGEVNASTGIIDEIGLSASASFNLTANSKFFEHGVQYLQMHGTASFEGSGAPSGHITINGPGDFIGEASICGIPIPLYGTNNVTGTFIVDGDLWT